VSIIQRNIMRRVYYSYGLRLMSNQMFLQGFVLGACIALFGRLTHVSSIVSNVMSVSIGSAPHYIANAFVQALVSGEMLTVLVVLFMTGLTLLFLYRVVCMFGPIVQQLSAVRT